MFGGVLAIARLFGVRVGPAAVVRECDLKIFYQQDDGGYQSSDGEELKVSLDALAWDDAPGYHNACLEDFGSLGGYADGGHASG